MTQKPRRQNPSTTTNPIDIPTAPEPIQTPTPTVPDPTPTPTPDRLSVLRDYTGRDGLLPVFVAVSHDAVFEGQRLRVPVTDRVAGLVEIGFLEVEPHKPGNE